MRGRIDGIAARVRRGERLCFDDAMALFLEPDVLAVGSLANEMRERLHGDRTYFNVNMRFEATNVCEASCRFCAFAKLEEGAAGAHTTTLAQAREALEAHPDPGLTELHMVNGLHPGLPFEWYEDLLRGFKRVRPSIHLKCFTAVEIHYFAQKFHMTYSEVLKRLRDAGLGSLPGGGAEIFHPDVRQRIARDKADAGQYLAVHDTAHQLGIASNCTMLYGHVETFEHRVDHLLRLREQQDRSGGFQCFVPLAFHNENNSLKRLPEPTAIDDLRTMAVSRLLLDNIPHIKAYWVSLTVPTAQVALRFGADDLDGTIVHETIYHAAGSTAPMALTRDELIRLIREAGRVPIERGTLYDVIEELSPKPPEAARKVRERHLPSRALRLADRA
ncbi:MAG: aminofutalosine synthase MqnE [Proteobacteria bacterium]|nr:aminofutalosine synthase MqnE [Pseudomonadota bacterium]